MVTKAARLLAIVIVALAILSLFGWMTLRVSQGDKSFGILNEPIEFLYSFPSLFTESVEEIKNFTLPRTFRKIPEDFESINKLSESLVVLVSFSDTGNTRSVATVDLKTDSILFQWTIDQEMEEHDRIFNPLILPEKSLIASVPRYGLIKLDSMSNRVWEQKQIWPNHSTNIDANGNIWVCAYIPEHRSSGVYTINGKEVHFKDEYMAKVDAETGEILFQKSIAELLVDNGLTTYLMKSGSMIDPIHINDVEPVHFSSSWFKKGDVFISSKNLSTILHYRPETDELIRNIEGPFICQHDVDVYDDSTIVLFNNNYYQTKNNDYSTLLVDSSRLVEVGSLYSQIVRYNFNSSSYELMSDSILRANKIFTATEGLVDFFEPNGCLVEQQNDGVLWVIQNNQVVYKNVLPSFHEGYSHLPNWTRVLSYGHD